jgi:hypothetical protein
MKILYCLNPLDRKKVEDNYIKEKETAQRLNISFELFDYDEFLSTNEINGIETNNNNEICIYRGWMMQPSSYNNFYTNLQKNNLTLINTPEQYKFCHWLPESYETIKDYTPKSVWIPNGEGFSIDQILNRISIFNGGPLILKDYVKSMKHFWNDACFISASKNKDEVNRVVSNFLKYLYGEPQGGLVFREFLELEPIGIHSKSKMPLTKEFRLLYLNNNLLSIFNYWDEGKYDTDEPDINKFNEIAKGINSNLFTMDIAKTKSGDWAIVELGDGQVAGFPENADLEKIYKGFKKQEEGR